MSGPTDITFRASASNPCPVCGAGTKGCSATVDGLRFCRGESRDGWFKISKEPDAAGFHHYRDEEEIRHRREADPKVVFNRTTSASDSPGKDWGAEAKRYEQELTQACRDQLTVSLRLPTSALGVLPLLGFSRTDAAGPCWTFPEVDAAGNVAGILRRLVSSLSDGTNKLSAKGGKRGLVVATGWAERAGPVFCVEGPTDLIAMCAAELACVARPSNSGGTSLVADLFRDIPADRPIIIVGENDQKPDGKWPGRDGARAVASGLAKLLGRPISFALPPESAKDVHDLLTAAERAGVPDPRSWGERGAELYFTRPGMSRCRTSGTSAS